MSTLGPRRLRTETWTLGVEERFLRLVRAEEDLLVPIDGRAYVALGFVLFEAYAGSADERWAMEGEWPRRWRLRYVGRQTRNLP